MILRPEKLSSTTREQQAWLYLTQARLVILDLGQQPQTLCFTIIQKRIHEAVPKLKCPKVIQLE